MNITLRQLVEQTNFKEYRFIVSMKEAFEKEYTCEVKLKDCIGILNIKFEYPKDNGCGWKYYDIAENWDAHCKNANEVAYLIDKCKLFKMKRIEHFGDKIYFHLSLAK